MELILSIIIISVLVNVVIMNINIIDKTKEKIIIKNFVKYINYARVKASVNNKAYHLYIENNKEYSITNNPVGKSLYKEKLFENYNIYSDNKHYVFYENGSPGYSGSVYIKKKGKIIVRFTILPVTGNINIYYKNRKIDTI